MRCVGRRGAPGLVIYQRSVAAAAPEQRCMNGMRLAMEMVGLTLSEMQGPESGVRRTMMQSWATCWGVCPELVLSVGCAMKSQESEWVLRVLVEMLQFLQWESGQSNRSGVDPKGQ